MGILKGLMKSGLFLFEDQLQIARTIRWQDSAWGGLRHWRAMPMQRPDWHQYRGLMAVRLPDVFLGGNGFAVLGWGRNMLHDVLC